MPRKLLLADDSVTIQRVIELTFADEDIQVIAVGDGRQAIERVERERPDIILADVGMPERDGYEVAAFVKSNPALAQIPVVLLTGAFEPIDESRARAVGCDGVLVKPFEPQMVINRVRDLLAGRRPTTLWSAAPTAQGPVRQAPSDADLRQGVPAPGGDSLEAYFDRLDAAFSGASTPPEMPASLASPVGAAVPPAQPPAAWDPHDEVAAWDPDLIGDPTPASAAASAAAAAGQAAGSASPDAAAAGQAAGSASPDAAAARQAAGSAPPHTAPAPPHAASAGQASAGAFSGASAGQASGPATAPPLPAAAPAVTPPSLVEAFAALLTAEQRNPIAAPAAPIAPALDDRAIEEIAQRVLSRFEAESMRPAVLEVAERLVREEIERLKQNR
jgi:CheY-like chemotaxis protein